MGNVPVYSMCNGTVVYNGYDAGGYGNYIIMKDSTTGMGFLYGHLHQPSPKSVGSTVSIGEYVGLEGTTGHSTGIHLHLELQDLSTHDWIYHADKSVYTNPATFMGIPNVEGISVIYNGTPGPTPGPTPEPKRSKFPWVLYARKFRNRF
jgi:murein DD-endopeptidase MepM/ murein hydrolase activator NlpD